MLAAEPQAHEPRRYSPEERHSLEQAQWQRHLVDYCLAHDEWRQDALVDRLLRTLDDARQRMLLVCCALPLPSLD